jgi:hypothetical protein
MLINPPSHHQSSRVQANASLDSSDALKSPQPLPLSSLTGRKPLPSSVRTSHSTRHELPRREATADRRPRRTLRSASRRGHLNAASSDPCHTHARRQYAPIAMDSADIRIDIAKLSPRGSASREEPRESSPTQRKLMSLRPSALGATVLQL